MVTTERRTWKFIMFSMLTLGIYGVYFYYKLADDVNTICAGDGKETAGVLKYILLGICTLGIYPIVWQYRLANRLQENSYKYNLHFEENGTTVTLWTIFGSLLFGTGPFIALYIIIKNMNRLSYAYMEQNYWRTKDHLKALSGAKDKMEYEIGKAPSDEQNCVKEKSEQTLSDEQKQAEEKPEQTLSDEQKQVEEKSEQISSVTSDQMQTKVEHASNDQQYPMPDHPVKKKNFIWIPVAVGGVMVVMVLFYLSYYFAWIPLGKNLYACVNKKLSIVKMMHPVTHKDNGNYYIGNYVLAVDPDTKVVTGIGIREGETKVGKYNIRGLYYHQSLSDAKSQLESKFVSLGYNRYAALHHPDYFFSVEYDNEKVSTISLTYWKQEEREKSFEKLAKEAAADGDYLTALTYYEGILTRDVRNGLDECRYNYGKELYDEGAYFDAKKYFKKISNASSLGAGEWLGKIEEISQIFNLTDDDESSDTVTASDQRTIWYELDSDSTEFEKVFLFFDEDNLEKWQGNNTINAYAVQSWESKEDSENAADKGKYQLKLRRLSDDRICAATLSIQSIKNKWGLTNVSSLDIVVDEKVFNTLVNGVIVRQTRTPVTKYYTNSAEYNKKRKELNDLLHGVHSY